MKAKPKTETRHGKLAETTSQTSITMNKALLNKARAAAKAEGRSLSNWLEQLVKKGTLLSLAAFLAFHAARPASKWTLASLSSTAKTGFAAITNP